MALFGKADQELPYLTQFRQVEPTEVEGSGYIKQGELYEFLRRDYVRDLESNPELLSVEREIYSTFGVPRRSYDQYLLLHPIVCRIMDALADDREVPAGDFRYIEQLFDADDLARAALQRRRIKLSPWIPTRIAPLEDDDGISPHLARAFVEKPIAPLGMMTKLLNELFNLLAQPDKRGSVARCDECGNSFVLQRKGRRFCSARCASRTMTRRKRARDAESVVTSK